MLAIASLARWALGGFRLEPSGSALDLDKASQLFAEHGYVVVRGLFSPVVWVAER